MGMGKEREPSGPFPKLLFYLISIEEFEEKIMERLRTSDHFDFDEFEKKILKMEADKIDRYIRRKKREIVQAKVGDHLAGVVYAETYHSELGNELGKEYPHLDYIAIVIMGGKRISLRTIYDHIDVSESCWTVRRRRTSKSIRM